LIDPATNVHERGSMNMLQASLGSKIPAACFHRCIAATPSDCCSRLIRFPVLGGAMMRRRDFITLVGGAAAWPVFVHAQQSVMPVIGFLSSRAPGESANVVAAFRQGLQEAGFVEGQNVLIAFRWAEGRYDQLPALAVELVELRVAVIFAAGGPPSALAAKTATQVIPVVFSAVNDPIRLGLVASLNKPGANVTGMSLLTSEMVAKSTQLLRELVPTAKVIGYLVNPSNPSAEIYGKEASIAASALGVTVRVLNASTDDDIDKAFATLPEMDATALVVPAEPFLDSRRERIVALSKRYAIAMISNLREYVVAGGLVSYGASLPDSYRRAAIYAGRILKGDKPADLPVMEPTKYDLVINLKTAKALGVSISPGILSIADEVIE
jgi:putative ABC transport system substrate-binding protein